MNFYSVYTLLQCNKISNLRIIIIGTPVSHKHSVGIIYTQIYVHKLSQTRFREV